jgi:hypothetical protein
MSKVVGFVIGTALIVAGVVTGNVGLIVQGGAMVVTQAVVDLTMPKTPARFAAEMQLALGEQPRAAQFGETFTAGSLVDGFNYGGKYGTDWECLVIRLADHKCQGLVGFYVNDEYVLYTGDGNYPHFDGDHFELYFRSDTTNQPPPSVVTTHGPGWTSADVGESGCDVVVCYKADAPDAKKPAWPGGRPRFGFVIRGKLCYDPRKDSSVAGGSGAHRWDVPSTWEFSANPVVCRYNWARGIYANDAIANPDALLIGRGLTAEEAPPENIIAPANLCDEGIAGPRPYTSRDDAGIGVEALFATDVAGSWMARFTHAGTIQWWNLATRTYLGTSSNLDAANDSVANVDLANDGTAYFKGWYLSGASAVSALWTVPPLGPPTRVDADLPYLAGRTRVFDLAGGTRKVLTALGGESTAGLGLAGYLDGSTYIADAQTAMDFWLDSSGDVWCLFEPVGSSNQFTLKRMTGAPVSYTLTGLVTRAGIFFWATGCHVAAEQHFVVVSDNKFYLVNDHTTGSPGTIKASGDFTGETLNLPRKDPSQTRFRSGFDLISLADMSVIEAVDPGDWVGANPDLGTSEIFYDPINPALVTSTTPVVWRDLTNGTRFRIAGPVYANQDFIDVEQMFAAACAGNVITTEGSVELEPAQAKSIVATFTDADLVSGTQVRWNKGFLGQASQEWVNTVVCRYVEPTQQWSDHAAPAARVIADIIADGRPREASVPLRLVRDSGQAQVIAEIYRRLGRLWGRATATLGPRFCELEDGDWVQWQSDRYFGGATKTFRVEAYQIDKDWRITLTLREIDASVFADDIVYLADQSNVAMTVPPPPIGAPDAGSWTLSATTLDSAGASVPALTLTGASEDPQAEAIIVEYWKDDGVLDPVADPDSIPWVVAGGRYPPDTQKVDITSIVGTGTYYEAVSYVVSGQQGDRLVLGPVTVGDLDISAQLRLAVDVIAGSSYTIAATDPWRHKRFTNSALVTLTIPTNATAAYPIGGRTRITQAGGGQVQLVAAGGVTLNSRDGALRSTAQNAVFEIEKVGTDEWDLLGDLGT